MSGVPDEEKWLHGNPNPVNNDNTATTNTPSVDQPDVHEPTEREKARKPRGKQ